jgi:hypothetical protein
MQHLSHGESTSCCSTMGVFAFLCVSVIL